MTGQLAPFDMTAKPIASIFEPPTIGMPNPYSGGGSTFSGIEGLLMDYAMSDAMGSAQQNAKQKVSSVMSGIKSLVSEAFPNFSMGTGSGTVGGGNFNPTPSPVPFADPPAIPSTPMQPPMMGDLSQISTPQITQPENDILNKFGITTTNYQGPVTTPAFTGPNGQNTYVGGTLVTPQPMGEPAGPPPGLPPIPPMVGGSGMGNPMALIEPPMIPKIADIGPVTANPTPKVSVEESGPVFQDTYNPAVTTIDDILAGQGGFLKKQVEDPLINLAYNFNMENSPF